MDEKRKVLSYSKLKVVDARGNELPTSMHPTPDGVFLAYQDAGAVYPVTIDPLIVSEEQKLTASDMAEDDHFGKCVTISSDTAVISGHVNSGFAYIFRLASSGEQELVVFDHTNQALKHEGSALAVPGQQLGSGGSTPSNSPMLGPWGSTSNGDGDGNIRYEVDAASGKKFYHVRVK